MTSLKCEIETRVDELKRASNALLSWAIEAEHLLLGYRTTDGTDEAPVKLDQPQ